MSNKTINVSEVIRKFDIQLVNKNENIEYRTIKYPAIHRLGLEISGISKNKRYSGNVVCWGTKESIYFKSLTKKKFRETLRRILSVKPPMVILSKGVLSMHHNTILEVCNEFKIPLYIADKSTSKITSTIGTYLSDFYSEETQVHGCLLSIHGIGVLIIGKSGSGKSEATHELIQRGHLFVADDAVLVKHIGANFFGYAPYVTKDLLEMRGTGLINILQTYGIKSIMRGTVINLCVELVENANIEYNKLDRLGDRIMYYPILGGKIQKVQVPVKVGASVSSLIEAAVIAYLSKREGFNALSLLTERQLKISKMKGDINE
ncbi:HPr(Ser) kinase/phosphatase [Mycoplasma tauri]|uniref:HPr(Ser) kinase/phosphatase n=1 Tax=Mycoplasma tauri TaxID=547987 RepID=A0A953NGB7_9MOLU|nr:HPr(Ser) kinase/phosphatase [Mycoplasma tauri]MBZ4195519.1 HPr(Ser) kinase/phosphatase [Mycoplasma tauri]MBZ4203739.1 HPr(Ser) kinase/phosphatase [Mycoplasma tauri]MBZ4204314.1 HPr(Ser) kinase/phosphatase [Mycoplasma tauri]MBZ4218374.1 HPr(Ser) kinase/phosphatase [Mycoplasma tauri]MBZ4226580.1 HPr(Ser) kinase/phosphatase [Mycoplasma tauri]